MFRGNRCYQHENVPDLVLDVIRVQYRDNQRTKLKVWYKSPRGGLYWPTPQNVEIRREEYKKWKEVTFLEAR